MALKKPEINWYMIVSLVLGFVCIILYFFPFFSYTSPSHFEDQYYYSGFEMTTALFMDEDDLKIEEANYQEQWMLLQLKNEEGVKVAIILTMICALAGFVSVILTMFFLLFERGKWPEIITSIFSTICFTLMLVLVRAICSEMDNAYTIGYIEAGSRMISVWGLYTVLVVNALFTCTNILRHDKKVQARIEQKKNS